MSYRALLRQRCTVLELAETAVSGSPVIAWQQKATNVRCLLDLNYIRIGKDPMWTENAGRPADRTGVLFLMGDAPIKSGDRIIMTKGPAGTFLIKNIIDEVWTPQARHHLEVSVEEVATQLSRAAYSQP